jgi:hypothetical protein
VKRAICVGLFGAVAAAASAAHAQEFAKGGHVVIAAERLTGVYYEQLTTEEPGRRETDHSTRVGLLGMPSGSAVAGPAATPRLAADVFVIKGLSLGGSIMYLNDSGSNKIERPTQATDNNDRPTASTFIFSPRIGYALQLADFFAIWPRGGVTYANYRTTDRNPQNGPPPVVRVTKVSTDFTDISLEFMLAFLPVDHFAVLVGPYFDIPLGGGQKTTVDGALQPVRPDVSYLSVGLSAGIGGFF